MTKNENSSVLDKQGLRGAQFVVEVTVDNEGKTLFMIRTMQGVPVRRVETSGDVAQFFNEVCNEITADHEG